MAWQKDHKKNTKENILNCAAALFTHHGFENVSIDQVMTTAQLTRGAFYAHFKSKSDLYAQAIIKASSLATVKHLTSTQPTLTEISQHYLSPEHRDQSLNSPCPLAFLVTDITQQNDTVKNAYTQVFKGFLENTGVISTSNTNALQNAALMIGGLALAKAINDKTLSNELLTACQKAITQLA